MVQKIGSSRVFLLSFLIYVSMCFLLCGEIWGYSIKKVVFFQHTQFPLKVFFIQGDRPGPTVMVQGGIQGDEICGVLTAQSLLMSKVLKGNLIVVPRANIPSLLKRKRGINVDLNRRFDRRYCQFYEDHLADAIRFLISLCDGLIHLHEGSGFYSPVFISEMRNPKRYGQSFIIDTYTYKNKLPLGNTIRPILNALNAQIPNKRYWFKIFNTDTISPSTMYPEQRKSLTYYALTKREIPAFAIEVSKDIKNLRWKWKIQLTATKMVLKKLGVIVDISHVDEREILFPSPREVKILIGDTNIMDKRQITLSPLMKISHKVPPSFLPEIGLFTPSLPNLNLLRLKAVPLSSPISHLLLTLDGREIRKWKVLYHRVPFPPSEKDIFVCQLNNKVLCVPAGGYLLAHEGDTLVIMGILGGRGDEVLNLKGYLSHSGYNSGQDMGTDIILERDFFMKKYISPLKEGGAWMCDLVRERGNRSLSRIHIMVFPKGIYGISLTRGDKTWVYPIGEKKEIHLPPGEYHICIFPEGNYSSHVVIFEKNSPLMDKKVHIKKGERNVLVFMDTDLAKRCGTIYLTGK